MTAVEMARQIPAQTRRPALLRWFGGFVLCLALAQAASLAAAERERFDFRPGESFAFLGDEITSEGSFAQYVENFFLTRYPDRPASFTNAGCAHDTVADALERLRPDVIERGANSVFILLGTWDAVRVPNSEVRLFGANYGELLDRLSRAGIRPLLLSPPMFDDLAREHRLPDETFRFRNRALPPACNGIVSRYAAWLREEALRRGVRFVDAWAPMNVFTAEERKTNATFSLVPDSLQPDEGGHALIAAAILETLAMERETLGRLALAHTAESPAWKVQAREGGAISQLEGHQDRVSFRWLPDSLPWAFPDAAMIAVQTARMDERFNRQVFHLTGLAPGSYELTIGGEKMPKTYSHLDLAKGLELQFLPERPDQAQAYQIACANQARYAEVIRPLSELRQTLKRVRLNFPADDARYLKTAAELSPREKSLSQQAEARLRELYRQAKPVPQAYEFRRLAEAPAPGTSKSSGRRHR